MVCTRTKFTTLRSGVSASGAAACDARDVKASFRLLLNDLRLCVWAVWDGWAEWEWAMTCVMGDFKLDGWQWALAQQQAAKLCLLPTVYNGIHAT